MNNSFAKSLLNIMPKRSLSDAMYWLTRRQPPAGVLQMAIKQFASSYNINLDEVAEPVESFRTFDEFFTRKLKSGAREIDTSPTALTSPSDGTWSEFGEMDVLHLTQIKGKQYSIEYLLSSKKHAQNFASGSFATIYLSPRDYHRVHFPCDGKILEYHYIPGEVFPVNPMSVNNIDHLFSRNERLITYLDTQFGEVAIIMVAATCVSAITASYLDRQERFTPSVEVSEILPTPKSVKKGQELGVFHMGSTVVMVFPDNTIRFKDVDRGVPVKLGQKVGEWIE